MTLRIRTQSSRPAYPASVPPRAGPAVAPLGGTDGDSWLTRLVKMIPAEAIGLYGTALPHVKDGRYGLQVAAVVALAVALTIRYVATTESGKKPQLAPLGFAAFSYFLWLWTLPTGQTPFWDLGDFAYLPTLGTLAWVMVAPLLYKGEEN